jgi:Na+/melibiose symporter-like transporter
VWLLIGVPTLLLGLMRLFNPGPGVGFGYFLLWLAVMYLGFTMTRLPYHAWGGELSGDYHGRTAVAASRQTFSILGLVLSTIVPALVLGRPGATGADVLRALSIMSFVLMPLLAALVFFAVPEPPPSAGERRVPLRQTLRLLWRNGPFKRIMIVLLLGFAAETFRQTITIFFARDVVGVPNIGVVYVYYFIAGLAAVPLWRWLGSRLGKHRTLALAFVVTVVTNLALFLVGPGQVALFTAMFVLKGSCFGALELLPAAIVADTADVDTAMSRERRQGVFFAGMGVIVNIGMALGQFLSLNLLGLVGYQAAAGAANGPDQLLWLRIFYTLLPSALLACCIWLTWRYPLTAERHARLRRHLDRRDRIAADLAVDRATQP